MGKRSAACIIKRSGNVHRKVLRRYLIRNSFKLFLIYMASSIMVISIYDNSTWQNVLTRSVSIGALCMLIFFINAQIIAYYKWRESQKAHLKNVEKRIFATGYLCTILILSMHFFFCLYLSARGIELHLPENIQQAEGWKMVLIILYFSLIQYTFIYLIQNFTLSQYEKGRIELELLKLKSSRAETVNLLLQQQIKPHFLFNALNTLKSLIRKQPERAENYLIRLSDFLRASFVNTGGGAGLSSVKDELDICNNYMEMQKVRFGAALQYSVDPALATCGPEDRLPVFSLQPLLENALKHNIATVERPLEIALKIDGDLITVSNNLQYKNSIEHSTGNGLSNLRERYKVLSGDQVLVRKDEHQFSVSIKIVRR